MLHVKNPNINKRGKCILEEGLNFTREIGKNTTVPCYVSCPVSNCAMFEKSNFNMLYAHSLKEENRKKVSFLLCSKKFGSSSLVSWLHMGFIRHLRPLTLSLVYLPIYLVLCRLPNPTPPPPLTSPRMPSGSTKIRLKSIGA